MIEASVPTMILFCVKSTMLLIYINGRLFGQVAFISATMRNLLLMKGTGPKCLPFIYISTTSSWILHKKRIIVGTLALII